MQAWGDYLDGLRTGGRLTSVDDVADRRSNVSTGLDNPARSQNNSRRSVQKDDGTVSQMELFCGSGGE